MDHLPCPASAIGREKTFVPYVCQEKYDGGPFMTYPSRTHSLPDLYLVGLFPGQFSYAHQLQLASLPKPELESFYQTWLFFGLLHEILGSLYVPEDFTYICEDRHGYTRAISTSKLITALEKWIARIQANTANPPVTYAHVARCLCMIHAALNVQTLHYNFDPNIKLWLASLGQTFAYAANKAFNLEDTVQCYDKCPATWCSLIDDDYWKGRFLARGWCMTEVKLILDNTLSLQTRHFLACLDKRDPEQKHQRCDIRQCMVYQNDLGAYQTKHVSKECDCEELSIDSDALYTILRTNTLPLIRVRRGQTLEELSVDIVASRPTSRYVALSHVWADGLGNPHANALPRCQLSYIGRIIKELDTVARYRDIPGPDLNGKEVEVRREEGDGGEELLLWCDTLCCPVQPEEAKHLALEYMYKTYRGATHVLVLDASLRRYNVETFDIDEVSMIISTSPWIRRLWTLQEGALPAATHRLWFQLTHKAVGLRELRVNARDKYYSSLGRRGLAGDMLRRLGSFFTIFLKDSSTHPRANLTKVIEALHHRSVSVLSDEPLLIGNLVDLDAAQILNGGDGAVDRRINRLWRLMPSAVHGIPSDLLFRVGPRLAEPGLRWAPATLLVNNDVNIFIQSSEKEEDQAILTHSDGLLVRLHGFRLSLAPGVKGLTPSQEKIKRLGNPNTVWMKDNADSWYLIRRRLPVEQDKFLTNKTLAEVILEGGNLWVILRPPTSTAQSSIGIIVEVHDEGGADREELPVKKAHAKLHINVAPIQASISAELALATALSTQLIANSPALRKLAAIEDDLDERSSSLSLSSKTVALKEFASEIKQIAMSEEVEKAVAADGKTFDTPLMESFINIVLEGRYVCMGEKTPRVQPWCVD